MNSVSQVKSTKEDGHSVFKFVAIVYTLALSLVIFLNDYQETRHLFYIFATVQYLDKIGHLFIMGSFSYLVNLALNASNLRIGRIEYLKGSLIVFAIVTIEECSQLFLVSRTFEFADMFFNTVGILVFGEFARLTIICSGSVKRKFSNTTERIES